MNLFKIGTLHHVRALQPLLQRYKAEASIDAATFVLQVRARNRYYSLYPQFMSTVDGRTRYSTQPDEDVLGFVGWLPYFNRRWPIGTAKFPFKEYCAANGLRTPRMWRSPAADLRDFVVKINTGSFGQGLHGPFRSLDPSNPKQVLGGDGYYEAFIGGRILKAFFYEDRLACLEMLDMPSVEGNGKSSVRELVTPRLGPRTPQHEWQVLSEIVAFDGLTLDSVPEAGRRVVFDFRYGSSAHPITYRNTNVLPGMQDSPVVRELVESGRALWQGIPPELREATLFSVDAIADEGNHVWLLEMNCNPVCHPDVYPLMFERLFGPADALQAPAGTPVFGPSPHPAAQAAAGAASRPLPTIMTGGDVRPWRLS